MVKGAGWKGGFTGALGWALAVMSVWFVLWTARLAFPLRERVQLQKELQNAKRQGDELAVLHPHYVTLQGVERVADWDTLPETPARRPLSRDEVPHVSALLENIAEERGWGVVGVDVKVASESGKRLLKVNLSLTGQHRQIPWLLRDIIALPALDAIHRLATRVEGEQDRVELDFSVVFE